MKNSLLKYLLFPLTIILLLINISESIAAEPAEETLYTGLYFVLDGSDHGSNAAVAGIRAKNIFMEAYLTSDDVTAAVGLYKEVGDFRMSVGITNFNDFGAVAGLDYKWFSIKVVQYTKKRTRQTLYSNTTVIMPLQRRGDDDRVKNNDNIQISNIEARQYEEFETSEIMVWVGGVIEF